MRDIELYDDGRIVFQKKMWHDSEIVLAKCYNFSVDFETGTIIAMVGLTFKKAIYHFIKLAFKSFSEALDNEVRRNDFYGRLEHMYALKDNSVTEIMERHLPYYDKFYQHQKDTLMQAFYHQFFFGALDMGLGKTAISASISRMMQAECTLIVCPAAVKWNWFRDLTSELWGFNQLFFTILDRTKRRTINALNERFIIVNYDIIGNYEAYFATKNVRHIIFDESHYLKNHNTARFKAVQKIVKLFPEAKITFLSGSPVANRVNDIFAYLKLINHELGHSYKKFITEFTVTTSGRGGERVTGGKNLQDLNMKLANFMIRKTKEECLDLPGKIFLSYRFELDDYREEYDKIIEEMSQRKEFKNLNSDLHSLNILTSKAKLPGIKELAETIIDSGKKVVIFGSYREPINELQAYFGDRCVKIDGSVDSFTRDQHIQRFHNDPECMVFLGNMRAAGVGINLTNASDVIFLNFPFTPSELYQATDRCIVQGQKVITDNGFKNIEEITIGDVILTHKGNYKKVTDVFSKIERTKCFVDLKYKGFDEILSVTEDHKIYVFNKLTSKYEWKEAVKLDIKTDFLVFPGFNQTINDMIFINTVKIAKRGCFNQFGKKQKTRAKIIKDQVYFSNELMFAMGWFLADGWSSLDLLNRKSSSISVCGNAKTEVDVVNMVAETLRTAFGMDKYSSYDNNNGCYSATIRSKDLAYNFKEWFGANVYCKTVPWFIFQTNLEFQKHFLDGFYGGDGYQRKNTQQATIKSHALAIQIAQLECIQGNTPTIRLLSNDCYSVEYSIDNKVQRTKLIKNESGNMLMPISEMKIYKPKRNRERVYDLTVEDDNSFVVGMASVHNCDRIGQKFAVNVHYTFCDESIDEYIYEIIVDKEKDINALIDQGKEAVLRESTTEILMKKLLNRNNLENVEKTNFMDISEEEYSEDGESEQGSGDGLLEGGNEIHNGGSVGSNEDVDKAAERENSSGTEGVGQTVLRDVSETQNNPSSISESFEDMQQLVQHMNDNGSQFIPNEPKGVVTDEMVNKSWEHFEKNKVKPGRQVTLEEGIEEAEKQSFVVNQPPSGFMTADRNSEKDSNFYPTFTLPDFD